MDIFSTGGTEFTGKDTLSAIALTHLTRHIQTRYPVYVPWLCSDRMNRQVSVGGREERRGSRRGFMASASLVKESMAGKPDSQPGTKD